MRAHTNITTKLALLFSLVALGALGLGACSGGDDDEITGASETEAALSPEQELEQIGNKWAPLFAAGRDRAAERYQTQPLSERITCNRHGEPIENCTPPSSEFRESFEDATVEDIGWRQSRSPAPNVVSKGRNAAARFSNGETVEFYDRLIHKIGGNADDELAVDNKSCGRYGRWRLTVEGDISCLAARRVMRGFAFQKLPGSWICSGPDGHVVCTKEPGIVITARF
jgi:hypothetical protein